MSLPLKDIVHKLDDIRRSSMNKVEVNSVSDNIGGPLISPIVTDDEDEVVVVVVVLQNKGQTVVVVVV